MYSRMFILDEARPFGIEIPGKCKSALKKYNGLKIIDSEDLADDLFLFLDDYAKNKKLYLVGSGGVIAYTLMSRLGLKNDYEIIDVNRLYKSGNLVDFKMDKKIDISDGILIDDVIASGETLNFVIRESNSFMSDAACLIISGDIRSGYRQEERSTVSNIRNVICPQKVDYKRGFPAIFSSRMLLKKVREDNGYRKYVSKYAKDNIDSLLKSINEVDITPFNVLYDDPEGFIKEFGGIK
ncbi:MAG: phosphoribosyltransferase domain-containing protein [Nanoarchaeota archaeon]|nr:phosphoribosyltransferase domain-containing protein [Nanoarchaeota archaeon]